MRTKIKMRMRIKASLHDSDSPLSSRQGLADVSQEHLLVALRIAYTSLQMVTMVYLVAIESYTKIRIRFCNVTRILVHV